MKIILCSVMVLTFAAQVFASNESCKESLEKLDASVVELAILGENYGFALGKGGYNPSASENRVTLKTKKSFDLGKLRYEENLQAVRTNCSK